MCVCVSAWGGVKVVCVFVCACACVGVYKFMYTCAFIVNARIRRGAPKDIQTDAGNDFDRNPKKDKQRFVEGDVEKRGKRHR